MEPMVVFSTGLVVYFSYRAVLDVLLDLQHERAARVPAPPKVTQETARGEKSTYTQVVGMEKLSKILAIRNKRFHRGVTTSAMVAWQRQGAM